MMGRRVGHHPRPGLPHVNLLSEAEFDRMAAGRLQRRFVAAGVALLLLVGFGWYLQHVRLTDSRKLVAVEQAETARLGSESQTLLTVKAFVTGVASQDQTVQSTMSREIWFSKVVAGIRAASPSGTSVESMDVTIAPAAVAGAVVATDAGSVCPGPDPFQTEVVTGCVTLSGTAFSRAEVGELVTNLGANGLFVEPFISTTTAGDGTAVTFSGSVGLSEKVFTGRYGPPPTAATTPTTPTAPAAPGGAS